MLMKHSMQQTTASNSNMYNFKIICVCVFFFLVLGSNSSPHACQEGTSAAELNPWSSK